MDLPIRGLSDGFDTPLQDFWGTLVSIDQKQEDFGGKGKPKLKATFNFKDVKVILSTEPYNFPTAPIVFFWSGAKRSGWGILSNSITKLIPEDQPVEFLIGKKVHMVLTAGHTFGKDKKTNEDIIKDCWEVLEIEGIATKLNARERVLDIIDGKTDVQFNQAAVGDPVLKTDSELMSQLIGQTLLPALEASNKIKKDEGGVWHKVKA